MPIKVKWSEPDPRRGTGRTRAQLEGAKKGAVFIWCNEHIGYPKQLARDIGRGDILIYRRGALLDDQLRGLIYPEVIVDHAAVLTADEWEKLTLLRGVARG